MKKEKVVAEELITESVREKIQFPFPFPFKRFKLIDVFIFTAKWGQQDLFYPWGLDIDQTGNVYVADYMNCRIVKYDSNGAHLANWGYTGPTDGHFLWPIGVAVDPAGNVYVSDYSPGNVQVGPLYFPDPLSRVQKFTSTGTFIAKLGGSPGSGNGQLNGPMGMACDSSGNLYVADAGNNRIQKFDSNFNYLGKWGTNGAGDGQFSGPADVAIDSAGNVYVADSGNNRIQKFDSNGAFLAKWGTKGTGSGQFDAPMGVAADPSGHVFVVDCVNNRIQRFNSNGAFMTAWGSAGTGDGQFETPNGGIAVDSSYHVFVADSGNNRIEKFNRIRRLVPVPLWNRPA